MERVYMCKQGKERKRCVKKGMLGDKGAMCVWKEAWQGEKERQCVCV
jgi:hypothetical protein